MFKNLVIGLVAVVALGSVIMGTNVQARLNKVLGVTIVAEQTAQPQMALTDCEDGAKVLSGSGFSHVFATDCSGAQYRFNGFRGGKEYTIVFNAQSNGFAVISR